jgi:hypothetical protein
VVEIMLIHAVIMLKISWIPWGSLNPSVLKAGWASTRIGIVHHILTNVQGHKTCSSIPFRWMQSDGKLFKH